MAAANSLSTLHPHLDDLIAKFVHQPTYRFKLRYLSHIGDGKDTQPYTNQCLIDGYLIIKGEVEIAKGTIIKINQDISKPETSRVLNSILHFFDDESGVIYICDGYWFLKRKLNMVKLRIGDCSLMVFDLNDHSWIHDLVKLFQKAVLLYNKPLI